MNENLNLLPRRKINITNNAVFCVKSNFHETLDPALCRRWLSEIDSDPIVFP